MFGNKEKAYQPKLLLIGTSTAVDPSLITAMYIKDGDLVIRFSGIGYMQVSPFQLFKSVELTFNTLLSYCQMVRK